MEIRPKSRPKMKISMDLLVYFWPQNGRMFLWKFRGFANFYSKIRPFLPLLGSKYTSISINFHFWTWFGHKPTIFLCISYMLTKFTLVYIIFNFKKPKIAHNSLNNGARAILTTFLDFQFFWTFFLFWGKKSKIEPKKPSVTKICPKIKNWWNY